tara:strand:- start:1228 stop:2415 length:1188 start_codon:yes stop_codon:yes gene_type:complete
MAEKNKKFTFHTVPASKKANWDWNEKESAEFVKNGDQNDFPQQLIDMYNRSSVHASCINAIVEGVIGEGLTANEDVYLERANSKGESWQDVFNKAALDYKLQGTYAIEILYSRDRTRIEVHNIDYSLVRAKEKDERGHIPGYYVSTKFGHMNYKKLNPDDYSYLPVFDPEKEDEYAQIFVHRNYRPGQLYYSLPDYVGALRIIDLDQSIDNFHVTNINSGLAPSLAITTFTNGSSDQLTEIQNQLNGNYGGTDNAGALIYMDVDDPVNAPVITPIPQNGADNYYTTINDLVMQKILTAHRITSPMILGIKTEGQLGGRTEMLDAYLLLQNTVIKPYQQSLLKSFEMLLEYNYTDVVLGIEQKKLFDDGTEKVEVVTDQETTTEEEAGIEQSPNLA